MQINSEEEFESLIKEVDQKLIDEGIPIHSRQLLAGSEFARILKCIIPVAPISSPPTEGVYHGESLAAHIYKWFDKRYGNKLKIDFSPGSIAIFLRDDFWRIKYPRIYGKAFITSLREIDQYKEQPKIDKTGQGIFINIPNYREGAKKYSLH